MFALLAVFWKHPTVAVRQHWRCHQDIIFWWKESESEVAQSCSALWDPMDCSLPGSSVHGIFQARVLEWVAISFSRWSSWPRDWTWISRIVGRCFTTWATNSYKGSCCCLVTKSYLTLWPHGLKHARLFCPLLSPRVSSESCLLESVMPSNHLNLCHPLLLLPSVFPSIRVFSNESAVHVRWPEYWRFSIRPSSEYSGLISFSIDWFDLLAVQGRLSRVLSSTTIRKHQFFSIQPSLWPSSHIRAWLLGKNIALTVWTFAGKVNSVCHSLPGREVKKFIYTRGNSTAFGPIWTALCSQCILVSV